MNQPIRQIVYFCTRDGKFRAAVLRAHWVVYENDPASWNMRIVQEAV